MPGGIRTRGCRTAAQHANHLAMLHPESNYSSPTTETIDELIDTNPKCRLFFKIDLQEYFAALICLSADEFCQPFSWGGNFYVILEAG